MLKCTLGVNVKSRGRVSAKRVTVERELPVLGEQKNAGLGDNEKMSLDVGVRFKNPGPSL